MKEKVREIPILIAAKNGVTEMVENYRFLKRFYLNLHIQIL